MEVHHHSHTASDPDSHRGRKKWTHYLWEFLMLFLAVFCGFLAENQREHYIENKRAKKFAGSLIEDLQGDTSEIHLNKKTIEGFFKSADLVLSELKKPRSFQNDTVLQINGTYGLLEFNFFDPQMGSYEQMKNSGALRYFKQDLINKLTRYESNANRLLLQKHEYFNFLDDIITPFIINTLNTDFTDALKRKETYKGESVFVTEPDRATLNKWKNIILMMRRRQEIEMDGIEKHEKWALELIDELRKTYHLK
ncbi:MAG TPA: hypothetical protein VF487_06385 [Chitinophagaceae bacterium]